MRRWWRLAAVLAVQLGILAAVPARQVGARLWGTRVVLRTEPIDPYNLLSGHYLTLYYQVEHVPMARADKGLQYGDRVWLTLEQGDPAWTLVSVTREKPASVPGRASVRVRWNSSGDTDGHVRLDGADRFYVTEERGAQEDARRWRRNLSLVELRIGPDGTAAVIDVRPEAEDHPTP